MTEKYRIHVPLIEEGKMAEALGVPNVQKFVNTMARIALEDAGRPYLCAPLELHPLMVTDTSDEKRCLMGAIGAFVTHTGVGRLNRIYSVDISRIRLSDGKRSRLWIYET